MEQEDDGEIDMKTNRYPYCLVWTPLPLITALFPFIGHTGICTSEGIIHDFSGSCCVTVDDMAFGNPTKYVRLEVPNKTSWNSHIESGDEMYRTQDHNLFCNNCHSHCAYVLNQAGYQKGGWNMVNIAFLLVCKGKYTSFSGFIKTYIWFGLIIMAIFLISFLTPSK
jgi:hypothetical protein